MRSPQVDELMAAWRVLMTIADADLYLAALARLTVLHKTVPWEELTQAEVKRIVLDSTIFALNWEWGPFENRDEALEFITKHFIGSGPIHFFIPEFAKHMGMAR